MHALRRIFPLLLVLAGLNAPAWAADEVAPPAFVGQQQSLSADTIALMKQYSWREGCPVPLTDLSYLEVSYWGFDGKVHLGELVVHQRVAVQLLEIFRELFAARFPIERMRLVDHYQGSDDKSMADNNTSAFNCRPVAGRTDVYSNHSFGLAIDINPLTNPYVTKKGKVSPPEGAKFKDRSIKAPGLIVADDACHKAFVSRGWTWGGAWKSSKDYQHFEVKLDLNQATKKIE
jgi:hypothetical protein